MAVPPLTIAVATPAQASVMRRSRGLVLGMHQRMARSRVGPASAGGAAGAALDAGTALDTAEGTAVGAGEAETASFGGSAGRSAGFSGICPLAVLAIQRASISQL